MEKFHIFDKPFDFKTSEDKIKKYWDKHDFYHSKVNQNKKPYSIGMPPPNVTGDLTMGHVLNNTIQDLLIRWHRVKGYEACWLPGTDHASIATEAKVIKMLREMGLSKDKIGREAFLQHAWQWKEKYGSRIYEVLKLLGISCDWKRATFTMDDSYYKSVIQAIVKLYKDGFVYKQKKLVNWCPISKSVISNEEVISKEVNAKLWYIRYPFTHETDSHIIVATTRPETLFGDLAIAVNPNDERFSKFIGKKVFVPISKREIPIIADDYVEKDFGTGAVKITPSHDQNDFEVGKRHALGQLNIMNPDATLNDNVPEGYRNLDRFVAREKLIAELKANALLEKIEDYKTSIGYSERGHVPIEYYLSDQWYIKMKPLAKLALESTEKSDLKLIPSYQIKIWDNWLNNIHDWCISRQLWWGHRLPMYTCKACSHVHCEEDMPEQCEKCSSRDLLQDDDVLDTWASSWLWPFAILNWSEKASKGNEELNYFFPTDIVVTGPDIIFFWVARMVMASKYFLKKTPFKVAYFTPIIRDAKGQKMSKSLGNSPDVYSLIDTFGADALRFAVINQIVTGQDMLWQDNSCDLGKHFTHKIWNLTKFLTMNATKLKLSFCDCSYEKLESSDTTLSLWIKSEFLATVKKLEDAIKNYEFSAYTSSLYDFIWFVFCDWFVELLKPSLKENNEKTIETFKTAMCLFDGVLRLCHPIMPYLTEEIWQSLADGRKDKTLGFQKMPESKDGLISEDIICEMRQIQGLVSSLRTLRGTLNMHPGALCKVYTKSNKRFEYFVTQMEFLANCCFYFKSDSIPNFTAPILYEGTEYFVDLTGIVDQKKESIRLKKKIEKAEININNIRKKLTNSVFVNNAPKHIVDGAKNQLKLNEEEYKLLIKSLELIEKK